MKLIVGLGNPGKEYVGTRHNMGFDVLDIFADKTSGDFSKSIFNGSYGVVSHPSFQEKVYIAKPDTFMNLSGQFVSQFINYFKIDIEDIIVVYDDMALPEGVIRLRPEGSSGGQKGMQNIISLLGTDKIKRIRVGIGEPTHGGVDWVLGKPTGESLDKLNEAKEKAAKALIEALLTNFDKAMSKFN